MMDYDNGRRPRHECWRLPVRIQLVLTIIVFYPPPRLFLRDVRGIQATDLFLVEAEIPNFLVSLSNSKELVVLLTIRHFNRRRDRDWRMNVPRSARDPCRLAVLQDFCKSIRHTTESTSQKIKLMMGCALDQRRGARLQYRAQDLLFCCLNFFALYLSRAICCSYNAALDHNIHGMRRSV
ncbi:hypothetical protein BC826DRAFT_1017780 [Russula brevipes]|nr:hypothetical protein BC826DRAFT_1017780 [Russula brevipes]